MSVPTQITVSVDSTEYSRYERGRDAITASVVVQGGAVYVGEAVLVELVKARRSRDAVVASGVLTFNGASDPQVGNVRFYLPDVVDQDLISLVRHGQYFVRATSVTDDTVIGESATFVIRIITVERLKQEYLFGLTLAATEIKAPKFQPRSITGVTIVEVSPQIPLGFGTLQYIYTAANTANAVGSLGAGANGVVTVTAVGALAGYLGNNVTVNVVVPIGTSPLSVSYASNVLDVYLAVVGSVPDGAANTATLVAAIINALPDFTATASGSGATALSAPEGPEALVGGLTTVTRQLSWNGGSLVSIPATGTYILRAGETGPCATLPGSKGDNFICVRVSSLALLPTVNTTEEILIDRKKLDDEALSSFLDRSTAWLENDILAGYVEPTNIVTDRDPTTIQFSAGINAPTPIFTDTDYDFVASPLTYFVNRGSGSWVEIQTQFPQVLRVDSLFGAIANVRVIDIDLDWIEVAHQSGLLQLVPFNQEIAFDFVGLLWVNALRGASELPSFWHYNLIAGLRDATPDIIEMIAKKAAIDALTVAGMALRPGVGSFSLSRDGVSESISYVTSAKYGMYTGAIQAYKDWMDEHIKELKGKYRGPTLVVV